MTIDTHLAKCLHTESSSISLCLNLWLFNSRSINVLVTLVCFMATVFPIPIPTLIYEFSKTDQVSHEIASAMRKQYKNYHIPSQKNFATKTQLVYDRSWQLFSQYLAH